jgi:hypothetical protein
MRGWLRPADGKGDPDDHPNRSEVYETKHKANKHCRSDDRARLSSQHEPSAALDRLSEFLNTNLKSLDLLHGRESDFKARSPLQRYAQIIAGPYPSRGKYGSPLTRAAHLLFVPGGLASTDVINDLAFMAEFKRLAAGARYLTSVCTGSLELGAAGLLKGKRAACNWAWRDMLPRRCQGNAGFAHEAKRRLSSGDLRWKGAPLGQGSRASLLVDLPRDEMALLIELVVDLGVN